MKKFVLVAALLAGVFTANAQEESSNSGKLNVEVACNPFASTSASLENGRLNGKYDFNDKWGLRVGFGFGISTEKPENGDKITNSNFSLVPGVVYSFAGTEKLTPYVGGELVFGAGKTKVGDNDAKTSNFGVQAFTGMNYYLSKNLYAGVEFGIGFNYKKAADDTKSTNFAPYAVPAIRLGWAF